MMEDSSELMFLMKRFLERFSITMEQEYPSNAIEKKILIKEFEKLEVKDVSRLCY